MKKLVLLAVASLSSMAIFATNWKAVINEAPDNVLYQINGKTVKKAEAMALPASEIDTVAVYGAGEAPEDVKGGNASNGYVSIYTVVKQLKGEKKETQYPGGKEALDAFLAENLVYPEQDKENKINGYVVVKFMVQNNGVIVSPQVVKSLSPACDAEAMRLVQMMPKWEPGQVAGQNVVSMYQLPILFKCPRPEKPVKKQK